MRRAFVFLALFFGLSVPASAATLYISPSGSDSAACSQAAPCKTPSGAYGKAASGDTVIMAGGSYGSSASVGSGTKTVRFDTAPGETAAFSSVSIGASNVTFSGPFTASSLSMSGRAGNYVTNSVVEDGVIDGKGTTNDVGYIAAVSGVTWRRIDMGNNHEANATLFIDGGAASGSSGGVTGGVTNLTIEDSAFHDNYLSPSSSVHPQCIYLGGTQGTTIRRTRFWGCTFADVFVTTANSEKDQPKNVTMENNVFGRTILNGDPNTGQKPNCCHARDVVFRDGSKLDGVIFRYNTVRGPVTWPTEGVGAGGAKVYGNIFGESTQSKSGMDWHNNINGVSNSSAMWVDGDEAENAQAGQKVKPGDFRLKAGASAIDAGDPANKPADDADGHARTGTPDAGAYEFGSGGTPPADRDGDGVPDSSDACPDTPGTQPDGCPPPSDTTPPDTSITSGPSGSTTSTSASFAFSSTESGSTFECKLDSGSYAACTSPKSYSALATGSHTFSVRATDAAGNTDASAATQSWTVTAVSDTTPPDTSITSGPSGSTTSTSASFAFSSTESGSTFECKLDSGSYATCTSPKSYSGLATGSHTFSVRATDAAGNTDASAATRSWTVTAPSDTTPPDTSFTAGPTGPTNDATPAFSFSSTESGSSFECRVDSGAWSSCSSPWTTPSLSDGSHSVSVRATDAAGNTDGSPASRSFTVDTAAPTTTITGSPSSPSISSSATITFTVSEAGATSQCRLDGGAWTACTSPYQVSGLGLGDHTVDVRSTDAAGNAEATGDSVTWTVVPLLPLAGPADAPTVTLTAPAADSTVGRTFRFSATATAPAGVDRVEFWIDGHRVETDKRAPYKDMVTADWLHSGSHTATARVFDKAGQAASAAVTVKVSRSGGHYRVAVAHAMRHGAVMASAADGQATRLAGAAPRQKTVRVTLTRCSDRSGKVVDTMRLKADGSGKIDATRAKPGLCVLSLRPM